jgi:hypothetical protein
VAGIVRNGWPRSFGLAGRNQWNTQYEKKYQDNRAIAFCDNIKELVKQACQIGQKRKSNNDERNNAGNAGKYKRKLQRRLEKLCKTPLSDENAENIRQRLSDPKREYNRLFVFLDYPDVEPTNNHVERALRKIVIFRKICFGTRSAKALIVIACFPAYFVLPSGKANILLIFSTPFCVRPSHCPSKII